MLLFMDYHDDGIFPLLRLAPPLQNQTTISSSLWRRAGSPLRSEVDDIEQSLAQGGITVEVDLEQLNGDSVRSDRLSVRQQADGAWQLVHRGLNSKRHVLGPLVKTFGDVRVEPR